MIEVKIDKNVPIPAWKKSRLGDHISRKTEETLMLMEVGDSFLIELDKNNLRKDYVNTAGRYHRALKRLIHRKLMPVSRKIYAANVDNGFSLRIWLLEKPIS